ncbi:MAG: hypothetical protein NC818_00280 [Candidatus Omnitrophica bacterium]|nr:hypothetical protein [Candidatus Omnitrophota bacterium]
MRRSIIARDKAELVRKMRLKYLFSFGVISGFVFYSGLAFAEEKAEKLEDYSKYGYTLKYKDPKVYTTQPGEKESPYHQKEPQLPPALEGRTKSPQWSKPEKLQEVKPEELYMPPLEAILGSLPPPREEESVEEKILTKEGEISLEAWGEKVELMIEEVLGKEAEVKLVREGFSFTTPVTPVEEEEEKEVQEKPSTSLFSDTWEMLIQEGRVTLKPLGKVSPEDLEKIAAYLVDLLGRGGEITKISPEGIEVELK